MLSAKLQPIPSGEPWEALLGRHVGCDGQSDARRDLTSWIISFSSASHHHQLLTGRGEGLTPALVVAALQGKSGPITCSGR